MLRIPITDANSNDILARSVLNPSNPDSPLLKRGVTLTSRIINALRRMGIRSLWVKGDGLGYLENIIKEENFTSARKTLGELKKTFANISSDISYTGSFAAYRDRVIDIFQSINENNRVYCMLDDIRIGSNDILFHGGNVCYLSMLIGLEAENYIFEERKKSAGTELATEFAPLGLGALLHDIGKLQIDEKIRNCPPWTLSSAETELLKTHTLKGHKILKEQLGAITANMALCHHLNFDNTGYPNKCDDLTNFIPNGSEVHVFSRIVNVANAFDSLVGNCNYLQIEALEELNNPRKHHFDPKILNALNKIMPPFPLGSKVVLNTGHTAMVTDFDPKHPFRPRIILLKDPKGGIVPEAKQQEINTCKYPDMCVIMADNRRIDHLIPNSQDATWEDI